MAKTLEQIQAELEALKTQFSNFSSLSPVSYYTHQYSGEEIDDSVTAAHNTIRTDLSQSLTTAQREQGQRNLGVTWPCNPNLLDNWYFGNPVNQRGKTEYPEEEWFFIDRWHLSGDTAKLNDDGITITAFSTGRIIAQAIEFSEKLSGKTVTFSLCAKIISGRWYLTDHGNFAKTHSDILISTGVTSWTFDVNDSSEFTATFPRIGFWGGAKDDQITVYAAKLELGDTQTLAHQDASGEWVLNEIPDYGEQLRRCRRYCRAYKAGTTLPCLAYPMLDGGWYASAGLPTNSMRTTPTNNLGDGKKCAIVDLDSSDSTHDDMTMTNWGQNGNMLCLRISGGAHGTLTSKFPYYIKLKEDLIMSADL